MKHYEAYRELVKYRNYFKSLSGGDSLSQNTQTDFILVMPRADYAFAVHKDYRSDLQDDGKSQIVAGFLIRLARLAALEMVEDLL